MKTDYYYECAREAARVQGEQTLCVCVCVCVHVWVDGGGTPQWGNADVEIKVASVEKPELSGILQLEWIRM